MLRAHRRARHGVDNGVVALVACAGAYDGSTFPSRWLLTWW
ncbi:MAG: hypothetical protein R3A10_07345 [Caldilineaceae bacterium]